MFDSDNAAKKDGNDDDETNNIGGSSASQWRSWRSHFIIVSALVCARASCCVDQRRSILLIGKTNRYCNGQATILHVVYLDDGGWMRVEGSEMEGADGHDDGLQIEELEFCFRCHENMHVCATGSFRHRRQT